MDMKHQLATEGVPFINMLFQHAVLFLLHLMLYAMKFRRSFEYWLVLMGCKLNSCCPCYIWEFSLLFFLRLCSWVCDHSDKF